MQLTEVALSTILAGGVAGTAKAAQAYVMPHAGTIGAAVGTTAVAGAAAYGGLKVGNWTAHGDVEEQRSAVNPDVGPSGWLITADVATGVATLGAAGGLAASWRAGSGSTKLALAALTAGLGAATVGGLVGMVRGTTDARAQVDAWRTAHPTEVIQPPKPKAGSWNGDKFAPGAATAKAGSAAPTGDAARATAITSLTKSIYNSTSIGGDRSGELATQLVDTFGVDGATHVTHTAMSLYNSTNLGTEDAFDAAERLTSKYGVTGVDSFTSSAVHVYNSMSLGSEASITWADQMYDRFGRADGPKMIDQAIGLYNSTNLGGDAAMQQVYDSAAAPASK
jgi:hypothetical protein